VARIRGQAQRAVHLSTATHESGDCGTVWLHAPEHGRPMWNGMQIHLFHPEGGEADAGIDGSDLSAYCSAQGKRQE
jgi:hypothetical protein